MPTDRYPQDERLERLEDYLLGLVSEAEAERLDELSIADEEFAWRLRAAEDDLVDAYVRGDLPAPTRTRFEEYYLASPRHQERVEFARNLARATDRATDGSVAVAAAAAITPGMPSPVRHGPSPWRLLAAAAALVLAVTAIVWRTSPPHPEVSPPAAAVAAGTAREGEVPRPAFTPPADAPRLSSMPPPSGQASTSPVVTTEPVLLAPDTRAAGSIVSVTVPGHADRVAFDLRLETNDFPRYQATLKDPGTDRAVWQSGWIAPAVKRDTPIVPVAVPARALKTQHYTFELTGRTDGNRTDLVASYVFEVVPR